jgi:protease I
MGTDKLQGKKVAILATCGFEQDELMKPREALDQAGATTEVVSLDKDDICGWKEGDWGDEVKVDKTLDEVSVDDYDALLLPGGVMNPDYLRRDERAVALVKAFVDAGKPVAAICHGPWLLAEAEVLNGRRVTSFQSIKTDLKHAGAIWVDEPVVVDHGLVTSRKPDDIPAFNEKLIEEIAEGQHEPVGSGRLDISSSAP